MTVKTYLIPNLAELAHDAKMNIKFGKRSGEEIRNLEELARSEQNKYDIAKALIGAIEVINELKKKVTQKVRHSNNQPKVVVGVMELFIRLNEYTGRDLDDVPGLCYADIGDFDTIGPVPVSTHIAPNTTGSIVYKVLVESGAHVGLIYSNKGSTEDLRVLIYIIV